MRQLFPAGGPSGAAGTGRLAELYAYPAASPPGGRPWVRANMVASVDGAASVNGRSGGLSGRADRKIFGVLRSLADVILVGAGTARAEHYHPARLAAIQPELRVGRTATPPIAVISGRLDLDPSLELLTAAPPDARTIVITSEQAPPRQRAAVAEHADLLIAGAEHVDLTAALAGLAARGHQRVLTEGGPHLLGQLAAGGLLDELCLTVGPLLAGPGPGRIIDGAELIPGGLPLTLGHVLEDDGFLLCRYLAGPLPRWAGRASDEGERRRPTGRPVNRPDPSVHLADVFERDDRRQVRRSRAHHGHRPRLDFPDGEEGMRQRSGGRHPTVDRQGGILGGCGWNESWGLLSGDQAQLTRAGDGELTLGRSPAGAGTAPVRRPPESARA